MWTLVLTAAFPIVLLVQVTLEQDWFLLATHGKHSVMKVQGCTQWVCVCV